jgi:hypothetical protein
MLTQFSDEEETKVYTVFDGLTDEEIASKAKLESQIKKVVNGIPLPSKYREMICEIVTGLIEESVAEKFSRFGERLGHLEGEITRIDHRMEMRDLGHDTKDGEHDKAIEDIKDLIKESKEANEKFIKGVGAIILIIVAVLELWQ